MKYLSIITIAFCLSYNSSVQNVGVGIVNPSQHLKLTGIKKDTIKTEAALPRLGSIIFGIYCGECSHDCANMYEFYWGGNANTLHANYTDSFFRFKSVMQYPVDIYDLKKMDIAEDITQHIPPILLQYGDSVARFGCPDCTDGCDIYFRLDDHEAGRIREFYIDAQTEHLSKDVKKFAEYLQKAISQMNAIK